MPVRVKLTSFQSWHSGHRFILRDDNETRAALGVISEPVSMNRDTQKDPEVGINLVTLPERLSQTIELAIMVEITKN